MPHHHHHHHHHDLHLQDLHPRCRGCGEDREKQEGPHHSQSHLALTYQTISDAPLSQKYPSQSHLAFYKLTFWPLSSHFGCLLPLLTQVDLFLHLLQIHHPPRSLSQPPFLTSTETSETIHWWCHRQASLYFAEIQTCNTSFNFFVCFPNYQGIFVPRDAAGVEPAQILAASLRRHCPLRSAHLSVLYLCFDQFCITLLFGFSICGCCCLTVFWPILLFCFFLSN